MSLVDNINADIKSAMRAKEKEKLEALRAVKSAILLAQTEKGGDEGLKEEQEIALLQKQVKQRKDAAEMYKANGRDELAEKEMVQADVIAGYLPAQMSDEELTAAIKAIIEKVGATSPKEMGKVMGAASKELGGKAEGKAIADKVKQILSGN